MACIYLISLDANWVSDSLKSLQKALKGKSGFITVKVNVRTPWISAGADPEMGVSSWVKSPLPTGFGLGLFIWIFVITILFLSWYQGYKGWLIFWSQLLWNSCITGRICPSWTCHENKGFCFFFSLWPASKSWSRFCHCGINLGKSLWSYN